MSSISAAAVCVVVMVMICPHINLAHSMISADVMFDVKHNASDHKGSEPIHTQDAQQVHDAASLFSALSVSVDPVVDASWLAKQLADKHKGLVRAKGFVQDTDNRLKTIQVFGRRWTVTPAPTAVQTGLVCIAPACTFSEAKIRSLCKPDGQMSDGRMGHSRVSV